MNLLENCGILLLHQARILSHRNKKIRDQQVVDGDYLTLRDLSSEEIELLDDGDED